MKACLILIVSLLFAGLCFAQSDDPDVQRLDSLQAQIDSMSFPDTPALMHLVDSLSAAGEPADAASILEIGQGDLSAGRIEEALAEFDKAVQLAPDDPKALGLKGKTLAMLGRPAEALPSLSKAIELSPRPAEAHLDRAGAYNLMNNPEAALQDLQSALAADSTLKYLARTSPYFRSLQGNPKFQKLVR